MTLSNPKPWFHFLCSWASCTEWTSQDPQLSQLYTWGGLLGPRSRQTVVFNEGFSRTQLHQKSRSHFQLQFKEYSFQNRTTVSCRHHFPALVFHVYLQMQTWKRAGLSCHAYLHHSRCSVILINETSPLNVINPFPSPSDTFLYSLISQLV